MKITTDHEFLHVDSALEKSLTHALRLRSSCRMHRSSKNSPFYDYTSPRFIPLPLYLFRLFVEHERDSRAILILSHLKKLVCIYIYTYKR